MADVTYELAIGQIFKDINELLGIKFRIVEGKDLLFRDLCCQFPN